jgi:hypothetical protein
MRQLSHMNGYELALNHKSSQLGALSQRLPAEAFMRLMHYRSDGGRSGFRDYKFPGFEILAVFPSDQRLIIQGPSSGSFSPISGWPERLPDTARWEDVQFDQFIPFRKFDPGAPEVVVAPDSVPELMDMILKLQDPAQKEIRERQRQREREDNRISIVHPFAHVKAQIITLAG